jgi:ABC-type bacteriocin/lantibiotic exporter with double-glycine peptidase domain
MTQASSPDGFARSADRIEALLTLPSSHSIPNDSHVVAAIATAANAIGVPFSPIGTLPDNEPTEDAITRLAGLSGLVARAVPLVEALRGENAAPLIALSERPAESPALFIRRGRRLLFADASTSWHLRGCRPETAGRYQAKAVQLTPALPPAPLSIRDLLRFGLPLARTDLIVFAIASILAGCVNASVPLLTGPLFNVVTPEHDYALLLTLACFLGAAFIGNLAAHFTSAIAELRINGRIGLMLRMAAIDRAVRLADADAFEGRPRRSAPLATMATRSLETLHRSVWGLVLSLGSALLVALPSIAVLAQSSLAGSAIVAATFVGLVVAGGWLSRKRAQALMPKGMSPQSWMSTAYETIAQIDTVRAGAAEDRFFARWTDSYLASRHRFLHADRIGVGATVIGSGFEGFMTVGAIGGLVVAGILVDGAIAAAFVVAAGTVAGAGAAFIGALGQTPMLGMQRRMVEPMLKAVPPESGTVGPVKIEGTIRLLGVAARPAPSAPVALQEISLDIAAGEHIGIAGPSGAGKSTLIKAMLGLIPLESGTILYDDVELKRSNAASLRRAIGVVGQNGRLFPGSLLENVAAGLDISATEAQDALAKAGLADMVAQLPLGLSTPIDDANLAFSGGQVQRILLARAFAGKPRILVLDEATSALDPAVQAHVSASIDAMGATVIAIAHRLETLRRCDRIIVIEAGRIVETGRYDDLVCAGGLFATMVAAETDRP